LKERKLEEKTYLFWMSLDEGKLVKLSELPHLMAKAMHAGEDELMAYDATRTLLKNEELPRAVRSGDLVVRNPAELGMRSLQIGHALWDSVILPQDLADFLSLRGIGVRRIRHDKERDKSSRVVIAELADEIARERADTFPGWKKEGCNNDLRRDIAAAMNYHGLEQNRVPGILPHIRHMAEQGFINPRSGFNGLPSLTPKEEVDGTWYLSHEDAEKVRKVLTAEAQLQSRYAQQDSEKRLAGRFTLEEAATAIAEGGNEREEVILAKLEAAAGKYELSMYEPGKNARIEYGPEQGKHSCVRRFHEECYWDDLNKWLDKNEPRVRFRFPKPVPEVPTPKQWESLMQEEDARNDSAYKAEYDHVVRLYDERDRLLERLRQDHPYVDVDIKRRLSEIRAELARIDNASAEVEASPASDTSTATKPAMEPTPSERRAQLDIKRQRGARRRILEKWNDIEIEYREGADGHQVLRVLKRDKDEKIPVLKTVQNHLSQLRKEGLIP
jgi:hypothetical protein